MKQIVAAVSLCAVLASCSSDKSERGQDVDKPAPIPQAQDNTEGIAATGSAFLNDYQILPEGTPAACAKHEDATTIILGDMPAQNAASVIIDGQGVRALSIVDAEDIIEFTDHAVPVEVKVADGSTTISGQAKGTRVAEAQTQETDMTFIITASCA